MLYASIHKTKNDPKLDKKAHVENEIFIKKTSKNISRTVEDGCAPEGFYRKVAKTSGAQISALVFYNL